MSCVVRCDLCGKEITDPSDLRRFKVKELKSIWWESYWGKIDVHEMCLWELMRAVEKKRCENKGDGILTQEGR